MPYLYGDWLDDFPEHVATLRAEVSAPLIDQNAALRGALEIEARICRDDHKQISCAACEREIPLPDGPCLLAAVLSQPAPPELERLRRIEAAVKAALSELGVPQPEYPAPVTNAARLLSAAIAGGE
jgi:hypothetical protein